MSDTKMSIFRRIGWGTLFVVAYALAAMFAAGAGHGTYIFFAPFAPYGLGAVLLLAVFGLTACLDIQLAKLLFVLILLTEYVLIALFVASHWSEDYSYLLKTWSISPIYVLVPSTLFFVGNLFLWYEMLTSTRTVGGEYADRDQHL